MKNAVALHVLGRARLHASAQGAEAIVLPAKSLAMLVFIGMERKRIRREVLADMFWGDTGDDSARANLRLALSKLRQRLPGLIHADTEFVGIDSSAAMTVDALELLQVATSARQQSASVLGSAISHYRGAFLRDFQLRDCAAFDDWAAAQRQRIDRSAVVILRELVRLEQQARHLHNELRYLELWAQIEPWNEEPHMSLLRLLARVGSTTAALDRFEACRVALAETLGTKPSQELIDLADDIRRGNVSPVAPPPALQARAASAEVWPLLGRERDLARIRRHMASGERLITLVGPAGVGKSRLARALVDEIAADYPDGQASCSFDYIGRDVGEEPVRDHVVAALGSALGLDFSQTVQPMAMLKNYLSTRRVILSLDGFETCIAAAPAIAELLQAAPQCIAIVTSRVRLSVAHEWLHELRGLDAGDGVQPGAALALLRACARRVGVTLDEAREHGELQHLVELLDGSPLAIQFAAQSLRTLTPSQLAQRLEQGTWLDSSLLHVPEYRHRTLQDVMNDMWEQLNDRTQQAWARCALFRGTFSRDWGADCAGVGEEELTTLVERSIVAREAGGRLRMHELTRQYGLSMLDDFQRANEYRRQFALAVLARLGDMAPRLEREEPGLIEAVKAEISTLESAVELALPWIDMEPLDAALSALGTIYHRLGWQFAASRLLESVLARRTDAPPAYRIVWHYRAGGVMHNQYGYLHDNVHFRAVVRLGQIRLPGAGWGGWLCALTGSVWALAARPAAGTRERNAQRVLAHAVTRLLMARFLDGARVSELFGGLAQAWVAARRSGAVDARLAVLRKALAFLSTTRQRWAAAWLVSQVRQGMRQVEPVHEAFTLQQLGNTMIVCGRWEQAEAYLLRAAAALASLGYGYDSLECHVQLGALHLHQGDFARLLEDTRITEVEARTLEQPAILRWALMFKVQAMLRSGLGGADAARSCLHDIHGIAVRRTMLEDMRVRSVEALVASAQGERRHVLLLGQEILDLTHHAGSGRFYTLLAFALAVDVLLHEATRGDAADRQARALALQAVYRYLALARHLPQLQPRCELYRGWAHALSGRRSRAVRAWLKGLGAHAARPSPYDAARLHLLLCLHAQDGAMAAEHAAEARRHFAACGMHGPAYALMPDAPMAPPD